MQPLGIRSCHSLHPESLFLSIPPTNLHYHLQSWFISITLTSCSNPHLQGATPAISALLWSSSAFSRLLFFFKYLFIYIYFCLLHTPTRDWAHNVAGNPTSNLFPCMVQCPAHWATTVRAKDLFLTQPRSLYTCWHSSILCWWFPCHHICIRTHYISYQYVYHIYIQISGRQNSIENKRTDARNLDWKTDFTITGWTNYLSYSPQFFSSIK